MAQNRTVARLDIADIPRQLQLGHVVLKQPIDQLAFRSSERRLRLHHGKIVLDPSLEAVDAVGQLLPG